MNISQTLAIGAAAVGLIASGAALAWNFKGAYDAENSPKFIECVNARDNFDKVFERCRETVPILALANPYWAQKHSANARELLSERDKALARMNTATHNAQESLRQIHTYRSKGNYALYGGITSLALLAFGVSRNSQTERKLVSN